MKRLNIYLPDVTYEQLRKEAFDKKTSMSQLLLERTGVKTPVVRAGLDLSQEFHPIPK